LQDFLVKFVLETNIDKIENYQYQIIGQFASPVFAVKKVVFSKNKITSGVDGAVF